MKHPQFVLAADKRVFDDAADLNIGGITSVDADLFFENILGHTVIRRRHELDAPDTDLDYRQFLPYEIFSRFTREFKRTFFAYRRKPKSGESELHGRVSIGIGGHVDGFLCIWNEDGSLDLPATLAASAMLEKEQELDIVLKLSGNLVPAEQKASYFVGWSPRNVSTVNVLVDNTENVDRRHFALVTNNIVPEELDITISVREEQELEPLGFLSAEELMSTNTDGSAKYHLESWSRICLAHFSKAIASQRTGLSFSGPISGVQGTELEQREQAELAAGQRLATANVGVRPGHGKIPVQNTQLSPDSAAVTENDLQVGTNPDPD